MLGEPILIVDDNPQNLKLTRVLLVGESYGTRYIIRCAPHLLNDLPHLLRVRLVAIEILRHFFGDSDGELFRRLPVLDEIRARKQARV